MQIRPDQSSGSSGPVDPDVLRTLHRIHKQLSDLRERLDRGPKQIKARQGNIARLDADLQKLKAESKAARVLVDQKQLLLKSGEAKLRDLQVKLNQANSNREYQALRDQIAADEMAGSVLADEIIEGLEKLDEFAAAVKEAEQRVARSQEDLAKAEQTVRDQQETLLADVRRLEAELAEVEKALPDNIREPYRRLARTMGSDAMAPVEGEHCGGCHQVIPPNLHNALALRQAMFCRSCGRLLYLPEPKG